MPSGAPLALLMAFRSKLAHISSNDEMMISCDRTGCRMLRYSDAVYPESSILALVVVKLQ
jgi:hypothetical protein